jgi:hypothetical protein
VELVPTVISAGWASGVNAYLTVALLGLLGRAGVGEVPDELQRDGVIAIALVMFAIEFVTDKVPWLDSAWDTVHTIVRPAIGSAVGADFASVADVSGFEEVLAGGTSGSLALASHAVKASLRLGINTSPEPFSNIVVSLLEDLAVAGVITLALEYPVAAAAIALGLLGAGIALVVLLGATVKRGLRRLRERRIAREGRRGG